MSIFSNQGQVCTAGSRLFLHEKIHDKVLEKVIENAKTRQARRPDGSRPRPWVR